MKTLCFCIIQCSVGAKLAKYGSVSAYEYGMKERILVVEDDPAIRDMICTGLELADFIVTPAANGTVALQMAQQQPPHLVLLDWMMPMLSGIEFTRRFKRDPNTAHIPIIMLTAKGDEQDRVAGFEEGVDDYMVKPFSPRELVARIKAVLRRCGSLQESPLLQADLTCLDPEAKTVSINQTPITMGPLEFKLLEFFMRHPNRVYSREQLLNQVWGRDVYIDERTVDVQIRRLRKALTLHEQEQMVQTIRGTGYRFTPPASTAQP